MKPWPCGRTRSARNIPEVAQSLNDLAVILAAQGRLEDAEPLLREALGMRRKLLGNEHPDTLDSLNGLARVFQRQ